MNVEAQYLAALVAIDRILYDHANGDYDADAALLRIALQVVAVANADAPVSA